MFSNGISVLFGVNARSYVWSKPGAAHHRAIPSWRWGRFMKINWLTIFSSYVFWIHTRRTLSVRLTLCSLNPVLTGFAVTSLFSLLLPPLPRLALCSSAVLLHLIVSLHFANIVWFKGQDASQTPAELKVSTMTENHSIIPQARKPGVIRLHWRRTPILISL